MSLERKNGWQMLLLQYSVINGNTQTPMTNIDQKDLSFSHFLQRIYHIFFFMRSKT